MLRPGLSLGIASVSRINSRLRSGQRSYCPDQFEGPPFSLPVSPARLPKPVGAENLIRCRDQGLFRINCANNNVGISRLIAWEMAQPGLQLKQVNRVLSIAHHHQPPPEAPTKLVGSHRQNPGRIGPPRGARGMSALHQPVLTSRVGDGHLPPLSGSTQY